MKRSQIAFPKQLKGVPLAPSSRDGKRYCVHFQYDKCQEGDSCQLGLHKCAAVFRGGRTCHGNHPGIGCRYTDKHAVPEEANPEESPAQKKTKMREPEDEVHLLHKNVCTLSSKVVPRINCDFVVNSSRNSGTGAGTPTIPVERVGVDAGRNRILLCAFFACLA